jgi:hypothetical protein
MIGGLTCLFLLLLAQPALAIVYMNPAGDFTQGDFGIGLSLESSNRDLTSEAIDTNADSDIDATVVDVLLGLAPGGVLGLHAGTLKTKLTIGSETGETADGSEYGVSYRHNLDFGMSGQFQKGLLLSFRGGSVSDDFADTDTSQVDVGFGGSMAAADQFNIYGGAVYSSLTGTITLNVAPYYAYDFESKDNFGFFGGIELRPSPQLMVGVELHFLHESGLGAYIQGRF